MSYAGNKITIPNTSYRMPRGTIEKEQIAGARAYVINGVKAFGPILTGFAPFAGKSWPQGVSIFSDPFEKGLEAVFRDRTINHLNHLDQEVLRDGLIIHNNLMLRTLVFFPKDFLKFTTGKDDPQAVMKALGALVIVGDELLHLNREVVVASNEGGPQPIEPTVGEPLAEEITGDTELKALNITAKSTKAYAVLLSGSGLTGTTVTSKDDKVTVIRTEPQSDARLRVIISAPTGTQNVSLTVARPGGATAGVTVQVNLTKTQ
jgi:hypothetical protein